MVKDEEEIHREPKLMVEKQAVERDLIWKDEEEIERKPKLKDEYPLPKAKEVSKETWEEVRMKIKELFDGEDASRHIGWLVRLGWQCMSTYRDTDHMGGCNGARIR